MTNDSKVKTLVLTLQYGHRASYYDDWVHAYKTSPLFEIEVINMMGADSQKVRLCLDDCDLVILLHSATGDTLEYLTALQPVLAERKKAKLLAFVGNEFNSPYIPLKDKTALLKRCGVDIIATQLLKEAGEYIYANSGAKVVSIPHALNPTLFTPGKSHSSRQIDIGMRSYRYPPYLGDNDRNIIIDYFADHGASLGLSVDISTTKRFTPDNWAGFLQECRAVLSTETGSWYLQPDDLIVRQVHAFAEQQRSGLVIGEDSPLRRLARYLPASIKSPLMTLLKKGPVKYGVFEDEKLDFDTVFEAFFKNQPKCPVYSKAISSRNFDAIGTKTCQVMFPGRFNDILVADKHYIALKSDFSNIADVLEKLRDEEVWQTICDEAWHLVIDHHTYQHRAQQTYQCLADYLAGRSIV